MATFDNDNRIRLSPTEVDFDDTVGITGQKHDNFPSPSSQPRYDWMRSFLIGLLSNQSSESIPFEFRIGTLWFNRTKGAFEVYNGSSFVNISAHIVLSGDFTLASWFEQVQSKINAIQPRSTFSGESDANGVTTIPVPDGVQAEISDIVGMRPFVYINGVIVDPRLSNFPSGDVSEINLSGGVELNFGDKFVVVIEKIDVFITETIVAR